MFKKFILSLAIVTTLFTATPKAEAGLAIGYLAGNPGRGAAIGAITGAAVVFVGVTAYAYTADEVGFAVLGYLYMPVFAAAGALLDVDATLNNHELNKAFSARYPFLDNHESIENLESLAKSKLPSQIDLNSTNAVVSFSREEIATALETADITETQFEKIVSDLN